jgi:hypothetical protein
MFGGADPGWLALGPGYPSPVQLSDAEEDMGHA